MVLVAATRIISTMNNARKMVEVGLPDGLQNEKQLVPAAMKIALVERLAAAGLKDIGATTGVTEIAVFTVASDAYGSSASGRDAIYPHPQPLFTP